jgi:hypothetical protein
MNIKGLLPSLGVDLNSKWQEKLYHWDNCDSKSELL